MARKSQKGKAPPRYDEAFKAGAIRLVTEERRPAREVAQELGICIDTLRSWLRGTGVGTVREQGLYEWSLTEFSSHPGRLGFYFNAHAARRASTQPALKSWKRRIAH